MSDIVVLNVGGQRHEVCRSTLASKPDTKLALELDAHKRSDCDEYFFDRNSQAFLPILHYVRTGELHTPRDVCGSVFRGELEYWGIDETHIQECCWIQYCSDLDHKKSLSAFQRSQDVAIAGDTSKFRGRMWNFLNNPHSSRGAQIYAGFSVAVILLSIAVLCASTHVGVWEKASFEDFVYLYGADVVCDPDYYSYSEFIELCQDQYPDFVDDYQDEQGTQSPDTVTASNNPEVSSNKSNVLNKNLSYPDPSLFIIDSVCVALFTLEYFLKLFTTPRLSQFCLDPLNIIDLLAILPYFIHLTVTYVQKQERYEQTVIDALAIIQIFRMVRIFKVLRHFKGLRIFLHTLKHSWKEMILLLVFLTTGMILFGSLIYYSEYLSGHDDVKSIPHGFWWAIVTMTTVGYGDVVPRSAAGFFIGSVCTVMGVLFIAFSVPILVQNFLLFYNYVQYEPKEARVPTNAKEGKISP